MKTFNELGLHKLLQQALTHQKYETPTPIQAKAIPLLLEGKDLLGIAQTGTGKTAAFALPTLHHLIRTPAKREPGRPRALVLAPTRELALQIAASFSDYGQFANSRVECVFGGVKINRQVRALRGGCDVLVATPGRLLDLMSQDAARLDRLEILILDEADQMLDLGFIHDLRKILSAVPSERQTMLFSATMPKQIEDLGQRFLRNPQRVSVAPAATTAERVEQGILNVTQADKPKLLEGLLRDPDLDRALVFVRTKHGADRVVRKLMAKGLSAQAIHGNRSQSQRVRTLDAFRDGQCRILVATDIAARGIDVDGVSHVINFDIPNVAEQYVHRIGRTARAGREGVAISLVSEDDRWYMREVEKLVQIRIDAVEAPEGYEDIVLPQPDRSEPIRKPKGRSGGGRSGPGRGPKKANRNQRNSGHAHQSQRQRAHA